MKDVIKTPRSIAILIGINYGSSDTAIRRSLTGSLQKIKNRVSIILIKSSTIVRLISQFSSFTPATVIVRQRRTTAEYI